MSDLAAPLDAKLSDLDLAALLCSRVCHDVISPVGAIANGLKDLAKRLGCWDRQGLRRRREGEARVECPA